MAKIRKLIVDWVRMNGEIRKQPDGCWKFVIHEFQISDEEEAFDGEQTDAVITTLLFLNRMRTLPAQGKVFDIRVDSWTTDKQGRVSVTGKILLGDPPPGKR